MKKKLLERIETLETLVNIYSDRDQVRTDELTKELHDVNMRLLDIMTNEAV